MTDWAEALTTIRLYRGALGGILAALLEPLYALLYPVHAIVEVVQAVVHILPKLLTALSTLLALILTLFLSSRAVRAPTAAAAFAPTAGSSTGGLEVAFSTRSACPTHADTLL